MKKRQKSRHLWSILLVVLLAGVMFEIKAIWWSSLDLHTLFSLAGLFGLLPFLLFSAVALQNIWFSGLGLSLWDWFAARHLIWRVMIYGILSWTYFAFFWVSPWRVVFFGSFLVILMAWGLVIAGNRILAADKWQGVSYREFLGVALVFLLTGGLAEFVQISWQTWKWQAAILGLAGSFASVLVFTGLAGYYPSAIHRLNVLALCRNKLGNARWLGFGVSALLPTFYLFSYWGNYFGTPYLRLIITLIFILAGSFFASSEEHLLDWPGVWIAGLVTGAAFLFLQPLIQSSNYPFSLYWSEGNRFWDYSMAFAQSRYQFAPGDPRFVFSDTPRMVLGGLAYLLPGLTIRGMRIWYSFLFSVPYAILGWVAFAQFEENTWRLGLLSLWSMLFLAQGPIYTPLILSAILVAGFWRKPYWLAIPAIILAGYYARTARWTWLLAPGIWAGVLALTYSTEKISWREWGRAIILGSAGIFGGVILPMLLSAFRTSSVAANGSVSLELSPSSVLNLATKQPLLWNRLLPNLTYSPGILLGMVIAGGPLVALLGYHMLKNGWLPDVWQKMALWGAALAFAVVGITASVKIGGGSNLHNLDMFWIGLLLWATLAWKTGLREQVLNFPGTSSQWLGWVIALLVLIPVLTPLTNIQTQSDLPAKQRISSVLADLRLIISQKSQEGRILFMDQRQLLTFGLIPQVPLLTGYEKKYVMNEAMSADQAYFASFYRDLAAQRFALIISDPLFITSKQEAKASFGSENNAWVKWVVKPLLCFYQPIETYSDVHIQLLVPRADTSQCAKYLQP